MSTEIWILLVLAAAAASALITFFLARRGAPTRKQLNDLETELDSARNEAKQVEGRVSEHFERSAVLFGHLAKDYKAFLDHYSDSAQALGLSERRARELLEQGYQPLLTHLEQDVVNQADEPQEASDEAAADKASADKVSAEKKTEKDSSQPEPPLIRDVVDAPQSATTSAAEPEETVQLEPEKAPAAARSARVVAVDLTGKAETAAKAEFAAKAKPDPKTDRQAGQA